MELKFLGTSAGIPTKERNVTSLILDLQEIRSSLWMFDCGEGTQHQILHSPIKISKLEKIFITHLHGDHIFGLPGLLCSRSMGGSTDPLTLYGPKGICQFVETSLQLSGSFLTYPLEIIEVQPGLLFDDGTIKVTAYALKHRVECYGYRIEEHDRPGTLDAQKLDQDGIPRGPWMQTLKQGGMVTLEDGRTISGKDYLGAPIRGKSLAIFGDTEPTPEALTLAADVDVMVHEITLEHAFAEKANERGHSTTKQAATLARDAKVKHFIATHISGRYGKEDCPRLLAECREIFPNTDLAEDFAVFVVK
ncbi:ribonuclease Z [Xenorhabdus sp. PB30.3]|uniref:ribonuclease Z n=1 Tax=Xenorhabdus sp. PB30.3 TaxID=2788941 RepID=UPI001E49E355|nr:ribonuclease Z [Xenorhabdus sp. PB30.3]MCC8380915.1 ribonuclease Z [Xenorhabdus sp. PB30.3]